MRSVSGTGRGFESPARTQIRTLATMPEDTLNIGHTSHTKKTNDQMTIKTAIIDESKKKERLNPPHGNHENSRPRFWHLPLPHKPLARPKQWQEPNPPTTTNEQRLSNIKS